VCAKSGRSVLELHDVRKAYGDKVIFSKLNLLIERGDRIALVGPNGAGKVDADADALGRRSARRGHAARGHQVVMQYFAQDEATRLDPTLTVYETLVVGIADDMVPAIRNILGGFLFSGDDVYKKAACCRAASARGWPSRACCCARRTRCSSTSRRTISISTRRISSSKR
jgi:ATP-binding cassette subfamily F protein 3